MARDPYDVDLLTRNRKKKKKKKKYFFADFLTLIFARIELNYISRCIEFHWRKRHKKIIAFSASNVFEGSKIRYDRGEFNLDEAWYPWWKGGEILSMARTSYLSTANYSKIRGPIFSRLGRRCCSPVSSQVGHI